MLVKQITIRDQMETIELDLGKVKLNLSDFSLHKIEGQAVEARQEIYQRIFAGASELYPLDEEIGISPAQKHSIGAKKMILNMAIDNPYQKTSKTLKDFKLEGMSWYEKNAADFLRLNQGDFKEEKISKIISSL